MVFSLERDCIAAVTVVPVMLSQDCDTIHPGKNRAAAMGVAGAAALRVKVPTLALYLSRRSGDTNAAVLHAPRTRANLFFSNFIKFLS